MNLVELSPVIPLHNIYFTQILPLIGTKLRLGRAMAKQTSPTDVIPTEWQTAIRELELGLELARSAACQRKPVEAQLLLTLGKEKLTQSLFKSPFLLIPLRNLNATKTKTNLGSPRKCEIFF